MKIEIEKKDSKIKSDLLKNTDLINKLENTIKENFDNLSNKNNQEIKDINVKYSKEKTLTDKLIKKYCNKLEQKNKLLTRMQFDINEYKQDFDKKLQLKNNLIDELEETIKHNNIQINQNLSYIKDNDNLNKKINNIEIINTQ